VAVKSYGSFASFRDPSLHIDGCDVGPEGDVSAGHVAIRGDRWRHGRLGFAVAVGLTLTQPVARAAIEAPCRDADAGQQYIYLYRTKGFDVGDEVYIEDRNNSEVRTISYINDNQSIQLSANLSNSYKTSDNFLVSTLPEIHLHKTPEIAAGDYAELSGRDSLICKVLDVDNSGDDTVVRVIRLGRDFQKDDLCRVVNTNAGWRKEESNPVVSLQNEYPWDPAGQDVTSAEFLPDVDLQLDDNGRELWRKPGLWVTGSRERGSSQICLMLSRGENDIRNWTQFLGSENTGRPNPVIRHSCDTEAFAYTSDADLRKVWDSEDAAISVGAAYADGSTAMRIDYTGDGEVWGLVPVPFNGEVRTNGENEFRFKVKGSALNTEGDLYIKLLAADGSSTAWNFPDSLRHTSFASKSFSFSTFPGRKYLRAVAVGISLAGSGSGTLYIDDLHPFVPASWDEIVEDPTLLAGRDAAGEPLGTFACYFTARARPRQALTGDVLASGNTSCPVDVADTSDFDAGDIVVLYDLDNFEIGEVESVESGTRLRVKHIGYDEDGAATFEHDYSSSRMGMIANNTYRVSRIGGSYLIKKDLSEWERWHTDGDSRPILEPSADPADWDSLRVRQPSVAMLGSEVYMAYAGCCAGNHESIGFAKSSNFTSFTKLAGNPYIEPGAGFDSEGCSHPDLFMKMPYTMVHYTGSDGNRRSIGSAVHESDFHNSHIDFHVTMLLYPCASLGLPPADGCVLFDMGNFRIEVTANNSLKAFACVDGKWYETVTDNNVDLANGFGTYLVHDHWNLIVAQFSGDKVGLARVSMMPDIREHELFTRSPWLLYEDVAPGSNHCILERQYSTVPGVTDFSGAGQDVMFWGYGCDSGGKYAETFQFQVGRIVGVSQIFDGVDATDRWYCELANPVGEWGFSSRSVYDGASSQGVMLAQGHLPTGEHEWEWALRYLMPTADADKMFSISEPADKGDGLQTSVTGGGETILDPARALPPVVGSDQAGKRAWNLGYVGHVDIGLDLLDYTPDPSAQTGSRINLYREMLNRNDAFSKPAWHKFNLSAEGQTPSIVNSLAYYDLTDWDGEKFPDKAHNNDLYLTGSAATLADGYMGRTLYMVNRTQDSARALAVNGDFEKRNAGGAQLAPSASGWDSSDLFAPHLFLAKDRYRLLYTGWGKTAYLPSGEIVGDLFEANEILAGVTINGSFEILAGTTVSVYLSWTKKTNWGEPVWTCSSAGATRITDMFVALPGMTTDYRYNVRFKIRLDASPGLDASPRVKGFSVEYTDPGSLPSAEFMAEQDSAASSTPAFRVQLVRSDTGEKVDITDRVKRVSDITQEVPIKPDKLGSIVADDVTVVVENTDGYFSELDPGSVFYDRFYLDDEIRIFSGFLLPGGAEYEVTGRFYIDRVEVDNRGEAQIYCRSLLREAIDRLIGLPVGNQPNPKVYPGKWKVKDIMEDLLINEAGISSEDVFIEDFERYFSNVTIEEKRIGEVLQKLAQACDGVVYTNNQGDVYFRRWVSLRSGSYELSGDVNLVRMRLVGQRRDRLVKECIVKGAPLVQGTCVAPNLAYGRTVRIENEYIQQKEWADEIAANVVSRYNEGEREIELWSVYLPSVKILDTVILTEEISGISGGRYLIRYLKKNVTDYKDEYRLTSNLAK